MTELFVAGTGRWLPPRMSLETAVAEGLVERRAVWRDGIVSVCVSADQAGPEMAVHAARSALRAAGTRPDEIDLVLHACIYHQGHDLWAPASHVQHAVGAGHGPAVEIRQLSNGGMAALELAAGYLAVNRARRHALITTGDRFALPGMDRWRSDPGTVLADGGTALVLSTVDGYARVRALVTVSDASLEGLQRGADPFGLTPLDTRRPIDVEPAHRHFMASAGLDAILDRLDAGGREVIKRVTSEAGAELEEIAWFVLPNLGLPRLKEYFLDKFDIPLDRTLWSWGREIGHLGAGDQIAGLDELIVSGRLRPGQLCLLAGVGAGFTWSCAVVEMLREAS